MTNEQTYNDLIDDIHALMVKYQHFMTPPEFFYQSFDYLLFSSLECARTPELAFDLLNEVIAHRREQLNKQ